MDETFPFGHGSPFDEPPLGPGRAKPPVEFQCLDFCPICRTADVLRATMPEELRAHLHNVQREGLLAMRAMLDHYIQHLDREHTRPMPVEDIPIE
jgi:hypothetical protein